MPILILYDEEDISEDLARLRAELTETWRDRDPPEKEYRIFKRKPRIGSEIYYATFHFHLMINRYVECHGSNGWIQWYVYHKDWDPSFGSQRIAVSRDEAIKVIGECLKELEEFYDS